MEDATRKNMSFRVVRASEITGGATGWFSKWYASLTTLPLRHHFCEERNGGAYATQESHESAGRSDLPAGIVDNGGAADARQRDPPPGRRRSWRRCRTPYPGRAEKPESGGSHARRRRHAAQHYDCHPRNDAVRRG